MNKLFFVILLSLFSFSSIAQQEQKSLPFTKEQNQDGAKFVWFIYSQSGFNYEYVTTKELPKSEYFREVKKPQPGDVAWWPDFMAITSVKQGQPVEIMAAGNEYTFQQLVKLYGKPHFYRFQVAK